MKRCLTLSMVALAALCFALPAGAETITVYDMASGSPGAALGTLGLTRTSFSERVDKIVISGDTWLDTLAGAEISAMQGTWATGSIAEGFTLNSGTLYKPKSGLLKSTTTPYTWSPRDTGNFPFSFFWMTDVVSPSGFTWSKVLSTDNYAAFGYVMHANVHGSWSNLSGGATYNVGLAEPLATLYVTKGADVTFTATGSDKLTTDKGNFNCTFTTVPVPEPSTLVLLGAGLVGLVAFAWRRKV